MRSLENMKNDLTANMFLNDMLKQAMLQFAMLTPKERQLIVMKFCRFCMNPTPGDTVNGVCTACAPK